MAKFILVGVVVVIAVLFIGLVFQNKAVVNQTLTNAGDNLTIIPDNSNTGALPKNTTSINNPDNNQVVKKMTKEITEATINTNMGSITIEFFNTDAPKTVANFLKLAQEGFYNKVKFHRVIKGFMIQGGDPLTKDDSKMSMWGTGGPGYKFADEINAKSDLYTKTGYKKGIVAMANSGPNTNGSQFFIMAEDYALPPSYTIFGKVTSGLDVVTKIENTPTDLGDKPITPVVINSITLK